MNKIVQQTTTVTICWKPTNIKQKINDPNKTQVGTTQNRKKYERWNLKPKPKPKSKSSHQQKSKWKLCDRNPIPIDFESLEKNNGSIDTPIKIKRK